MRKVAWQKFRLVDGDFVSNTTFLSHFIPLPPLTPYYSSFLYSFVLNILYYRLYNGYHLFNTRVYNNVWQGICRVFRTLKEPEI